MSDSENKKEYQMERFGKYLLLEKLAMGGMAEVFLSKTSGASGIGKFVAIKRILPQYSSNEEFISMFTEEAKINVNLSHSNIVPIHEFGIEEGQFFLAMEFVEGKNLRQILSKLKKSKRSGFNVSQAAFIAKEVAAGLDHAHRCLDDSNGKPLNIIHRDMSPQNVMVSYEGEIKVVDFGIAKAESQAESTKAGTLKGKFSYMSPEQASGEKIDIKTDIFSLGILLWELLANERLFTSSSELNTLKKIREAKVPSLTKLNPKIPEDLEKIVNTALAKDPANRYQTAAEFYKDLNRFLNRFYPDFSSHDFSVFIKSIYADEILQNRKKFIKYSQQSTEYVPSKSASEDTIISEMSKDVENIMTSDVETDTNFNFQRLKVTRTNHTYGHGHDLSQRSIDSLSNISSPRRSSNYSSANLMIYGLVICGFALVASQFINFPLFKAYENIDITAEDLTSNDPGQYRSIIIKSDPSVAKIYVNDVDTGKVTKGRVKIPAKGVFNLRLERKGYHPREVELKSNELGSSASFTMQKISVGFLNINVKPYNAEIYINGQRLRERAPIKQYRVPASRSIRIKAINRDKGTYDERIITVDDGETAKINLRPRKRIR